MMMPVSMDMHQCPFMKDMSIFKSLTLLMDCMSKEETATLTQKITKKEIPSLKDYSQGRRYFLIYALTY